MAVRNSSSRHGVFGSERGSITPLMLGLMIVLLTIAMGMLGLGDTQYRETERELKRLEAFHLAEAGAEKVLWRLRSTPTWRTELDEQNIALGNGRYTLVDLVETGGAGSPVKGMKVKGCVPDCASADSATAEVYIELAPTNVSPFQYAAFGDVEVDIRGKTDSYNSNLDLNATNLLKRGDTGTNGTACGSNSVGTLNGTGYYPPNGQPCVVSGAPLNGIQKNTRDTTSMFQVSPTPPANAIPIKPYSGGSFTRADNNQVIPQPLDGGTYWVQGGITLTGNSSLNIKSNPSSPVILYVQGNIKVAGNGVLNNQSLKPTNLIVYGMSTCTSIDFSGNGAFYGALFAPKANVAHNGGGNSGFVRGSTIAKTVTGNGNHANFIYDEALSTVGNANGSYKIASWTQLN